MASSREEGEGEESGIIMVNWECDNGENPYIDCRAIARFTEYCTEPSCRHDPSTLSTH